MRRLTVFNHVTLDGYFTGPDGDLNWAHRGGQDAAFDALVAENATRGGVLLFGRVTYELMAAYWPTPAARENDPLIAAQMNRREKVVFSRTLDAVAWENSTLLKDAPVDAVRELKQAPGADLTILGSGSLVAQLAQANLIDEYQFIVNPVVLGRGRTMFEGVTTPPALRLTRSRTFGNGLVLLCYAPAA